MPVRTASQFESSYSEQGASPSSLSATGKRGYLKDLSGQGNRCWLLPANLPCFLCALKAHRAVRTAWLTLVYVYQIVLYRRAESGEIFHAEDTSITTTTDISGSMLVGPTIVTVLLYPLPHLHGVRLGLFSTCRSSVQLGLSCLRKVRNSHID